MTRRDKSRRDKTRHGRPRFGPGLFQWCNLQPADAIAVQLSGFVPSLLVVVEVKVLESELIKGTN
jgi:hypothetical protein